MCKALGLATSHFYYQAVIKNLDDSKLTERIKDIFFKNRKAFGTRKLKEFLGYEGMKESRRKIGKIMKQEGLVSVYTIKQCKKCVSDLIYVSVKEKWNYICLIINLCNRKIIGYAAGKHRTADLVYKVFNRIHYPLDKIKIFHTDRGSEFTNQEYLGHLVCNRNTSKIFKDKRLVVVPETDLIITKNIHDAIIDEETFEKVQKLITVKKDSRKEVEPQIFIGLLRCSTCTMTIVYAARKDKKGKGVYSCGTYRRYGKGYCSMHYITYDNLYRVVLENIRKHSQMANLDPQQLLNQLLETVNIKSKAEVTQNEKEIIKIEKRPEEINLIIKRLYEDSVLGRISNERFNILSLDYEEEQKSLRDLLIELREKVASFTEKKLSFEKFANIIQKYTDITELNTVILNKLIDKIIIYECEYIEGKRVQKIDIYYKFVGII